MVKRNIRFYCSALIVVLCFTMIIPSVFADMDSARFGQWMGTALEACNIIGQSTLPVTAPIADFISDPFNITEGVYTAINYAFPRVNLETPSMTLESYLQRSSIQVRGDTISIDGVDYQDIWVTNDAAQAFRTNVLDLQTAFNIASNSSGNFVTGAGNVNGVPIFQVGNSLVSQRYDLDSGIVGDYVSGSVSYSVSHPDNRYLVNFSYSTGLPSTSGYFSFSSSPATNFITSQWIVSGSSSFLCVGTFRPRYNDWFSFASSSNFSYTSAPFDFSWVSQSIPAEQLDSDDGIHLLVPNNPDQFSDSDVKQKINNFNLNLNNNFEFNTPIELGSDNNYSLFDSLLDIAFDLDIKPSFGPFDSYSPEPTPTPAPSPVPVPVPTPAPSEAPYDQIGTSPWSVLEEWLRSIREYLETIVFYLQQILDEIKNLPGNFSNIWNSQESGFGNWLKTILQQIGDGLSTGFQRLHDDFLLLFDDLKLFNIEFFGNVVDALEDSFEPLLDVLESVTSIWRYVVAWVGNISAPLSWTLSALGSAGSYFLSPFYAIAAGSIVIAIYKRFMR